MGSLAKAAVAAVFSLSLAAGVSATTLTNAPVYSGVLADFGIGNPTVHTVGQTFTVPVPGENILVDFSLTLGAPSDPQSLPVGPIYVRAALYEWNSATPELGGFIWDNGTDIEVDLATLGSGGSQELAFAVGVTLDPLLEYVAFLTLAGNDPNDPNAIGNVGLAIVDGPGSLAGEGVFFFDDGTTALWFSNNGYDSRFTANFAGRDPIGVPAPAALAIFGLGLVGLGLTFRLRPA